jgi:hypothetical protein
MFASLVEGACRRTPGLRPGVVGMVHDDWRACAAHDHPSKRLQLRRVDFHIRQEGGHMNEVASLRARAKLSSFAPAHFTDAGEDVGRSSPALHDDEFPSVRPVPPRTDRPRSPKARPVPVRSRRDARNPVSALFPDRIRPGRRCGWLQKNSWRLGSIVNRSP